MIPVKAFKLCLTLIVAVISVTATMHAWSYVRSQEQTHSIMFENSDVNKLVNESWGRELKSFDHLESITFSKASSKNNKVDDRYACTTACYKYEENDIRYNINLIKDKGFWRVYTDAKRYSVKNDRVIQDIGKMLYFIKDSEREKRLLNLN